MRRHAGYIALSLAVLGGYLAMVPWSLPAISADAGGRAPLDTSPLGYSVDEARAFVLALTDEGRALYLGAQHRLDTVFPGLLLIWSCWTLLKLLPRRIALALCVVAVGAAIGDYAENAAVTRLP